MSQLQTEAVKLRKHPKVKSVETVPTVDKSGYREFYGRPHGPTAESTRSALKIITKSLDLYGSNSSGTERFVIRNFSRYQIFISDGYWEQGDEISPHRVFFGIRMIPIDRRRRDGFYYDTYLCITGGDAHTITKMLEEYEYAGLFEFLLSLVMNFEGNSIYTFSQMYRDDKVEVVK